MSYYFAKTVNKSFEDSVAYVYESISKYGFGILTEIDVTATLKKKIDVDFKKYKILGACSPRHAYAALSKEDKIGLMLPCNIIIQEVSENQTEIAAIDPVESMVSVKNEGLLDTATEIQNNLKEFIKSL